MATYTWKVVSSMLGLAMPLLSAPAMTTVGLMAKFDSFRCTVLEAKENQQMVLQLYSRAGMVSAMIEQCSLSERRPQGEVFNELVSTFHATMEDVEKFYEKFWAQGWFKRLVQGAEVKSEFDGLWQRLDAHAADYRTLLLKRIVSGGPSERIAHPRLREFWRMSMNNVLEAKWVHFWEQLLHEFLKLQQYLSLHYNVKLLEAKADPRDPKFVGPWEINNLFQPPTSSIEDIISTALAVYKRPLRFAKSTRAKKRIRVDNSATDNKEVQIWIGYWERDFYKATQTVELLVAADHKIYGGGSDEIGEFTCSGECNGTEVHFVKHYIGQHQVEYLGALQNTTPDTTMGGFWRKDCGSARKGEFRLHLQLQSYETSLATGRDTGLHGVVQVGAMQHWTGHYNRGGAKSPSCNVSVEIVFTQTHKIYGSGEDSVGRFTWLGHYHQRGDSTLVSICQLYSGKRIVVHYLGAVGQSFHISLGVAQEEFKVVMEGSWMHSNNLEKVTFCLQPELRSSRLH
ncbi:unnamed protein product [Calypogeia fissa]